MKGWKTSFFQIAVLGGIGLGIYTTQQPAHRENSLSSQAQDYVTANTGTVEAKNYQAGNTPNLDYASIESTTGHSEFNWQVTRIADGDTVTVTDGTKEEKIRFACMDADEIAHGNKPAQPYGYTAKESLTNLINKTGKTTALTPITRDRYGRLVAELWVKLDDKQLLVQDYMVKNGLAMAYRKYIDKDCPDKETILADEDYARSHGLGIWSKPNPQPPWEFRHSFK